MENANAWRRWIQASKNFPLNEGENALKKSRYFSNNKKTSTLNRGAIRRIINQIELYRLSSLKQQSITFFIPSEQ